MRVADRGVATFSVGSRRVGFRRGRGAFVEDDQGNRYLDLVCGYGPVVVGHADGEYQREVSELVSEGLHFPAYSTLHFEYAKGLSLFDDDAAASYFKTSSEAMTAALRIAAVRTHRRSFVRCGFLGWHDALYSTKVGWHEELGSPSRQRNVRGMELRGTSGLESAVDWWDLDIDTFREILSRDSGHIGAAALDIYQEDLAGRKLAEDFIDACRDASVVSIIDETKTAGRYSPFGVSGERRLNPDIVILGKAIANGAPLSIMIVREYVPDEFLLARVGGTYSKECFGVASALVTRSLMRRRSGFDSLRVQGHRIVEILNRACDEAGITAQVRVVPRMAGAALDVTLGKSIQSDTAAREMLRLCLQRQGILLLVGHPSFVSLAHHDVTSEWIFERALEAFRAWTKNIDGREVGR